MGRCFAIRLPGRWKNRVIPPDYQAITPVLRGVANSTGCLNCDRRVKCVYLQGNCGKPGGLGVKIETLAAAKQGRKQAKTPGLANKARKIRRQY